MFALDLRLRSLLGLFWGEKGKSKLNHLHRSKARPLPNRGKRFRRNRRVNGREGEVIAGVSEKQPIKFAYILGQ
jgi:hypothetical protein